MAICTSTGSASLKLYDRDAWHTNWPIPALGNHFTKSRSSILSSRPTALTMTLMSSGRFSFPANTRPEFAMTEEGISAIFCVIAMIKSPYPADWSRICSNSDCPVRLTCPLPPEDPAWSLPVRTSFASSMTSTVSYWSSARKPPSCGHCVFCKNRW